MLSQGIVWHRMPCCGHREVLLYTFQTPALHVISDRFAKLMASMAGVVEPLVLWPSQLTFRPQRENTVSLSCNKVCFLSILAPKVVTWSHISTEQDHFQLSGWRFQGGRETPEPSRLDLDHSLAISQQAWKEVAACFPRPSYSTFEIIQYRLPFMCTANIYYNNVSAEYEGLPIYFFIFYLLCIYYGDTKEAGRQHSQVRSLLSPRGHLGWNSGLQAWRQAPLPTETAPWFGIICFKKEY